MLLDLYKEMLATEIEDKRRIMYEKANTLGYTHPEVITCSQELDALLNQYAKQAF